MNTESIIPTITSMGGGLFIGILLGYFIKKVIKIITFVAGGILGLLLYLQQQQIISIDIERIEASSKFIITLLTTSFENITQIGDTPSLGIPLTGGLSAGLVIGFMKG